MLAALRYSEMANVFKRVDGVKMTLVPRCVVKSSGIWLTESSSWTFIDAMRLRQGG